MKPRGTEVILLLAIILLLWLAVAVWNWGG
jgi:hypothetical protein